MTSMVRLDHPSGSGARKQSLGAVFFVKCCFAVDVVEDLLHRNAMLEEIL